MRRIKISLFASLVIMVLSCSHKQDGIGRSDSTKTDMEKNMFGQKLFDARNLEGAWWADANSASALFFIAHDSLYYAEQLDSPYVVEVNGDTLELSRGEFVSSFLLKNLTQDSLIFYDFNIKEDIKLFKKSSN